MAAWPLPDNNRLMTLKTYLSAVMLAVAFLCTSCLNSDDEVVTYEDTAVTAFTLGTVKCYRTVKTAAGKDSTYSYTYSASTLPVYIDQINNRIYNEDSLTVGTDVSRVLTSISTKNNGVALLRNLTDDNWTLYSSSDSIDYSQQRTLRVVSSDGQHAKDYIVDIRVHNEYADSFSWSRMPADAAIASFTEVKAVQAGQVMYLMGTDAAGDIKLLASADGNAWNEVALPDGVTRAGVSVAAWGDTCAVYDGSAIHITDDATTWGITVPDVALTSLLGGGNGEIYALNAEGKIMISKNHGETWEQDAMEDDTYVDNSPYVPVSDISVITSATKTNANVTRATMIGNKAVGGEGDDDFKTAVVWNKVVDKDAPQAWIYTNVAWNNYDYTLPRMKGVVAVAYADGILAIGGTPVNNAAAPYSTMYYSPDCGATWHTQASMNVPEGFSASRNATMVADGKGSVFLIGVNPDAEDEAGKCLIWRGKQNKVMWKTPEKYYE